MINNRNLSRCLILVLGVSSTITCVRSLPATRTARSSGSKEVDENQTEDLTGTDYDDSRFFGLYNMFGGGNPKVTPNGQRLIEGDIVVPANDEQNSLMEGRKAVPDSSLYWPNGEVIYSYHESITAHEMAVIELAMQHWRQHTCITFRQRQAGDLAFIRFRSDTQGCWSLVGRQINSPNGYGQGQDVSIGQGCANLNVVVHEIGHVLGFFHEQSRSDRDQFIDIVWSNVLPGYAMQFRKESDTNYGIPYDLTSTMQYPQWAFSKEIFEKSTIVARNPAYQRFLSKNYPLSFRDRMLANQMYSCTASCSASSCQNGGYSRAVGAGLGGASSCSCDCPPNYAGSQCEQQLRSDYYDELPCGGVVSQPGTIETPNYPQRTQPFASCMWDIQAPAGHKVSIKFNGFEFAPRFTKPGTKVINKCFNETVEIRLRNSNIYDGDAYCGTDIAPGTVLKSDGPRAVIIITANDKMMGTGLNARVSFRRDGAPETDDDNDQEAGKQTTAKPQTEPPTDGVMTTRPTDWITTTSTTENPFFSTPTYTVQPPVVDTLPPRPPPPPPPSVVTTSSLLEEYEKESTRTFPPVGPFGGF